MLVAGLGLSGCAAIEALLNSGANAKLWDDNPETLKQASRRYALQPFDIHILAQWHKIDALLPAPGIKPTHIIFSRANIADCQILSDIDLLQQAVEGRGCRFIGVTGTNGKSTTTALIAHILNHAGKKAVAGANIGDAALNLPMLDKGETYVLELSSYQLHHCRHSHFDVAILLNITPDHLEYHGLMDDYINAKLKIFARQKPNDLAIVGISTEASHAVAGALYDDRQQELQMFSGIIRVANGIYWEDNCLWRIIESIDAQGIEVAGNPEKILDFRDYPHLSGRHYAENIAAAWLACAHEGLNADQIIKALTEFNGLKHRQEYLGNIGNIHFVNDSKATNVEATQMALALYPNIYWLAGGQVKNEPHRQLQGFLSNVKAGYFFGHGGKHFHDIFSGNIDARQCDTLNQALQLAWQQAQSDCADDQNMQATILLAPAAASFDQFRDFAERGCLFANLVEQLKQSSEKDASEKDASEKDASEKDASEKDASEKILGAQDEESA